MGHIFNLFPHDTADRANKNLEITNENFQNSRLIESVLLARQKIIIENENKQCEQLQLMNQILVYSEIALLSEKFHTILLSKLQFALDQTQPDTIFSIIIRCITTREIRRAQNGSVTKKDFGPLPPSPLQKCVKLKYTCILRALH